MAHEDGVRVESANASYLAPEFDVGLPVVTCEVLERDFDVPSGKFLNVIARCLSYLLSVENLGSNDAIPLL